MTSLAKIESNRLNAQRSTGPRTAEGKARCCHNALKHGLLSSQAVLETEDASAHEEFGAALRDELAPVGAWEEMLAEGVVAHGWRLRRAVWMETCLLDEALASASERDALWREQKWDLARGQARKEGRGEADAADPCPRPWSGAVDSRFAGEALRTMMYDGNYLDILRRYQRAAERGMHESMRALQAAQAARKAGGAGAEDGAGNGAFDPCDKRCHGPVSAEDRAGANATPQEQHCETEPNQAVAAAKPGAGADDPGCHGPASTEDRAGENATPHGQHCETDPNPAVTAGKVVAPASAVGNSARPSEAEPSRSPAGNAGPRHSDGEAPPEPRAADCETDPNAEEERRLGSPVLNEPLLCV
jgi:hypothetical protein